eukprot:m.18520 g.18520  ORF g.18520 m.18520 type:complete len:201 (-) comp11512_c0_seq1:35-637(-)
MKSSSKMKNPTEIKGKGRAGKIPKTVLDKLVACIIELDQAAGSSRQSIFKLAKSKFGVDNGAALARAIKAGVAKGTLVQNKQSFLVAGHVPTAAPPEASVTTVDVVVGDGEEAVSLSKCTMKYVGKLDDGHVFDSANKFSFTIDAGEVIKGWDTGVKGMRVGGRRTITCPPKFAYGKRGSPPDIPPSATLTFDVTLLHVK